MVLGPGDSAGMGKEGAFGEGGMGIAAAVWTALKR